MFIDCPVTRRKKTEVSLDYCVRRQSLLYSHILEVENVCFLFSFATHPRSSYVLSYWLWKVSPIQLWTFSWSSLRSLNPAICLSSLIRPKDINNKLKLKKNYFALGEVIEKSHLYLSTWVTVGLMFIRDCDVHFIEFEFVGLLYPHSKM